MSIYSKAVEATAIPEVAITPPKIWFTSDNHFWHNNIIKYCDRPFRSAEEMNKVMIQRWNEKVKPEDTVYHLGDFSMSMKGIEQIIRGLNGTKVLVPGNHDACHPAYKKKFQVPFRDYRKAGFDHVELEMMLELQLKGQATMVKLCHLPYEPDEAEKADRRYMDMRPKDEGHLLLHGHVHTSWKKSNCGRMINVGVDQWNFYPITVQDIESVL